MVKEDNIRMTQLLITKGADVNAKGNSGETALSVAKEKGHTEIVELLRKHGAREADAAGSTTDIPQDADKKSR
jgi:ankyrin repeat protein